jgi:hypothetical protein
MSTKPTRFRSRLLPKNIGALCRIPPNVTNNTAPIHAKIPSEVTISRSLTSKYAHALASSHPMPLNGGGGGGGVVFVVFVDIAVEPDLHHP